MPGKTSRTQLIQRLMKGDLPSTEWPMWAASRKSLQVRIYHLREAGFDIVSLPAQAYTNGTVRSVSYRLKGVA